MNEWTGGGIPSKPNSRLLFEYQCQKTNFMEKTGLPKKKLCRKNLHNSHTFGGCKGINSVWLILKHVCIWLTVYELSKYICPRSIVNQLFPLFNLTSMKLRVTFRWKETTGKASELHQQHNKSHEKKLERFFCLAIFPDFCFNRINFSTNIDNVTVEKTQNSRKLKILTCD